MADYANCAQMLVPDQNVFVDAWGCQRSWLVLHKTAGGGSAQAIAQWFQSGADGAMTSSHYIVDLDGTIIQCVREKDGAAANCCLESGAAPFWPVDVNLNLVTFSIENVDPALDNSTPMPSEQKAALFALVKDLCTRQHIPMRPADEQGGIAGHCSIAPQSRAHCPGNFAWDDLWTFLQSEGKMSGIPQNWHDDGATLTAPNGYKVVSGFRQFILTHPWDALNYPLENEHGRNPLEDSNPGLGSGTQQMFRMTCLEYTPQRGVFVSWVGQEVLTLRAEIASLKRPASISPMRAWFSNTRSRK